MTESNAGRARRLVLRNHLGEIGSSLERRLVGAARFELATPRSQSECATNCATPRHYFESFSIDVLDKFQIFIVIFYK